MITFSFPGKVALVTGSSRGIGAAILEGFARGGATGVLHFWDDPGGANKRDADALAAKLGANVHALPADVRDAAQMEAIMKQVKVAHLEDEHVEIQIDEGGSPAGREAMVREVTAAPSAEAADV